MEKRESKVKDLVEKLKKGKITPKEAHKRLKERGLVEKEAWEIIPWAIYFILWLPLNFRFSDQLPAISFPKIVIYISVVVAALGMFLSVWATSIHYKIGGLKHDETIYLFKEGPYKVIRHPAVFGVMLWMVLLPIILSTKVPFTIFSAAAIVVIIVYIYCGCYLEEKLSTAKWGDEYRQYMKELPRFNFIKGLWNLRKR